ncbi:MAG: type II secretion system protein [Patescibacteria group bacterium]
MRKTKKGFTLIELLVVIAIIGILSAIGLVALNGAREKARDAQRKSDLSQIRTALTLFYDDQTPNAYPPTAGDSVAHTAGSIFVLAEGTNPIYDEYLGNVLEDPTNNTCPAGACQYNYILPGAGVGYCLYAQLEGGAENFYYLNSEGGSGEISTEPASGTPISNCGF